jgi:hypothetical protein
MRIDAITSCVHQKYCDFLQRSLPIWLDTLDSLTVVTAPNEPILNTRPASNLRFVTTSVFTDYGAYFNKGAALCHAFTESNPSDWCLHFDSDIIPPENWRSIAEKQLVFGKLHGARRYNDGKFVKSVRFLPIGYFQIWNIYDPACWKWPIFDPYYNCAAAYDMNFIEIWGRRNWKELPIRLIHQGKGRLDWFGVGKEDEVIKLTRMGSPRHRRPFRLEVRSVEALPPVFKFLIPIRTDPGRILKILHLCGKQGPFLVRVELGDSELAGWEIIPDEYDLEELELRINGVPDGQTVPKTD